MLSNKPIYQPWIETEFSADEIVQVMTPVQKWMYRTLLQRAFTCSTRPYLPNDDEELWVLAGCESKEQWDKNKKLILKKFQPNGDFLIHKRVFADYQNWEELIEKKRFAGKRSAEARSTHVEHMLTHDEQVSKEVSNISKASKEGKMGTPQYIESKIAAIWGELTGKETESKNLYRKDLRDLEKLNKDLVQRFEVWACLNKNYKGTKPISAFIREFRTGNIPQYSEGINVNSSVIRDLAVELSMLSTGNITFGRLELQDLAQLLTEFNRDELVLAFKKFYNNTTFIDFKWAGRDFIEKAPQIVLVSRKQLEESNKLKKDMESLKERILAETPSTIALERNTELLDEFAAKELANTFGAKQNG